MKKFLLHATFAAMASSLAFGGARGAGWHLSRNPYRKLAMTDAFDPAKDGATMSYAREMSYGDYLALDGLLDGQKPLSDAHDEMLFIIQHQTSELWMRLAIHELTAARAGLAAGDVRAVFKMLTRVARIFEQLNGAWDVLRTMTPSEYSDLRDDLGKSSGFQ